METLEAILTRRSIREYTSQPVPEELVRDLLAAAMQAPSASNGQPWHFIIITERRQLNALAMAMPHGQSLTAAPLGIVVCAELEKSPRFWVQDCSAATMNLLLAAHASGLGGVWLGIYPNEERVANVKQILGIPAGIIPLCIVSIGYPATKPELPERRYDETRLHYNNW